MVNNKHILIYQNINRIKDILSNNGRTFIVNKNWLKVTIAFSLTVAILARLCFSCSQVSALSIGKPSSPGDYYGPNSGFGYGSTTVTLSTIPSPPIIPSEPTSKIIVPWWGWLIMGVSFLITVLVMWRRDSTKH